MGMSWGGMRGKLLVLGVCALLPVGAAADGLRDQVIAKLVADGYSEITVSRTLLGRLRFVGRSEDGTREIVVQPVSGAVLRDHVDDDGAYVSGSDSSGSGKSGSQSDGADSVSGSAEGGEDRSSSKERDDRDSGRDSDRSSDGKSDSKSDGGGKDRGGHDGRK